MSVFLKNHCSQTPSFMTFTSRHFHCLCTGAWDLIGAFFYTCKFNYYLGTSIHPKMVKDNTGALKITIPSFLSPAELQMLLHYCGFEHKALCHQSFYSRAQGTCKCCIMYDYEPTSSKSQWLSILFFY